MYYIQKTHEKAHIIHIDIHVKHSKLNLKILMCIFLSANCSKASEFSSWR